MDSIYPPEHFNASNPIPITEYFRKYSELLKPLMAIEGNNVIEKTSKVFPRQLSYEGWTDLNLSCSIDLLSVPGEPRFNDGVIANSHSSGTNWYMSCELTDQAKKLKTVENVLAENAKKNKKKNLFTFPDVFVDCLVPPKTTAPNDLKPGEDVIFIVRLYRPFVYTYGFGSAENLKFEQEIKTVGSKTLADLRDKIVCSTQVLAETEYSEDEAKIQAFAAEQNNYPSGFIFIENVFYNDFREEKSKDYSEVIRQWALEKNIGALKTGDMQETRLDSLSPRLGYPYLYQHRVRCEHILIFTQVRLLKASDAQSSAAYPYHSSLTREKNTMCLICGEQLCTWLVVDCDRLPRDRAPLCSSCFTSYCYIDGRKVGSFKAYPLVAPIAHKT